VYAYVPQPGIAFYGGLSLKLGRWPFTAKARSL